MSDYKKIYYISRANYETLYDKGAKDGTITKNSVSYSWNTSALYVIPPELYGSGISSSFGVVSIKSAQDSELGGIKTGFVSSSASRNYKVTLDSSGNAYVNVPWTDITAAAVSSALGYTALKNTTDTLTGSLTVTGAVNAASVITSGDVTVGGNLVIKGGTTTISSNNLAIKDNLIEVASGNTAALTSPAGLVTPKYDGTNYGAMVYDKDGFAYVGDVALSNGSIDLTSASTNLQKIATRSDMSDGYVAKFDSSTNKLIDAVHINNVAKWTEVDPHANRFKLTNLVVNGNFANGTTGWTYTNASLAVSDSALAITPTAVNSAGFQALKNVITNHIFYFCATIKSDVTILTHAIDYKNVSSTSFSFWSYRTTLTSETLINYGFGQQADSSTPVYIKDIVCIDLTADFGSGREPTKAEMDALLKEMFPDTNGWFDGTNSNISDAFTDLKNISLTSSNNQLHFANYSASVTDITVPYAVSSSYAYGVTSASLLSVSYAGNAGTVGGESTANLHALGSATGVLSVDRGGTGVNSSTTQADISVRYATAAGTATALASAKSLVVTTADLAFSGSTGIGVSDSTLTLAGKLSVVNGGTGVSSSTTQANISVRYADNAGAAANADSLGGIAAASYAKIASLLAMTINTYSYTSATSTTLVATAIYNVTAGRTMNLLASNGTALSAIYSASAGTAASLGGVAASSYALKSDLGTAASYSAASFLASNGTVVSAVYAASAGKLNNKSESELSVSYAANAGTAAVATGYLKASGTNVYDGDLTITGSLNISGSSNVINKTNVSVADYVITLAGGNTAALTSMVGTRVPLYDGTNDGFFGWDSTGTAYIGDISSGLADGSITSSIVTLMPLVVRTSQSLWSDNHIPMWSTEIAGLEDSGYTSGNFLAMREIRVNNATVRASSDLNYLNISEGLHVTLTSAAGVVTIASSYRPITAGGTQLGSDYGVSIIGANAGVSVIGANANPNTVTISHATYTPRTGINSGINVDSYGHVTAGTVTAYLTASSMSTFTVYGYSNGSVVTTSPYNGLSNVNASYLSYDGTAVNSASLGGVAASRYLAASNAIMPTLSNCSGTVTAYCVPASQIVKVMGTVTVSYSTSASAPVITLPHSAMVNAAGTALSAVYRGGIMGIVTSDGNAMMPMDVSSSGAYDYVRMYGWVQSDVVQFNIVYNVA